MPTKQIIEALRAKMRIDIAGPADPEWLQEYFDDPDAQKSREDSEKKIDELRKRRLSETPSR